MKQITQVLEGIGSVVQLFLRSVAYAGTLPRQSARFIEQCYMIGYTTLPIVAVLSFFIGMVLALEAGYAMEGFGAKEFIGSLVGLSMARELGPMMTSVLLAGRVGSAITAELASMKVYQEIDALTTMNIPAAKILVLPRLAAVLVMMPVLIVIANIVGWFGGSVTARYVASVGISPESYFAALRHYTKFKDVVNGMEKAEVFGFVVVLVCCDIGLNTKGGPREIGASVTRAVVVSLIAILILDYFVSKLLLF
ncbi:MAG: ABC transporter permease [Opitutaceae bacterium]|jgi:phospholipid/cholesterol/gamma-HCH transport system permease protein